ncbi:DUF2799 domain-containing protein [Bacteriovorax sp. DB6_IX]|uniref:DUF2799 domain-containing protein n=1 Tax=Bacteriovorax sp. DB6_IX TaxID=1353530 RepID=UPI00038A366B|nr:DUF2799 domain-containing protein [Bacteriovorax sp. DB6_IX]EQC52340.1 PF10973 family protein [Bacteriovorax sp. DB6_IX]
MKKSLFIVGLLVVSCSTLKKRDCSSLDWFEQGRIDGSQGHRKSFFMQHAAKCHKKPDRTKYLAGREQGLKQFCTETGLYRRGYEGGLYLGECAKLSTSLRAAYELGRDTYRESEEIKEFQNKIVELEDKLKFELEPDEIDERKVVQDDIKLLQYRIKENFERIKALRIKAYQRNYIVKEN